MELSSTAERFMPAAIEEFDLANPPKALAVIVGGERPVVLRGLVRDWPAVQAAHESHATFARLLAGLDNGTPVDALVMAPEEEGVIGYRGEQLDFNYSHQRTSVAAGLSKLLQLPEQGAHGVALQSAPIAQCLPGFIDTHPMPLLDAGVLPRLWLGNRVTTPAHFDEYHNIACVACGARRFTLFPPEQVGNLYIGPLDHAPTGAAISVARLDRLDDPRYPRLREAMAHALVAELEPGDAIYIPPMWWHHVASLQRLNALVNYWWIPRHGQGLVPQTRLGGLLHAILLYRSLPPAERQAWRVLFDHYVFGADDPAAHLPASRRGPLDDLDEVKGRALIEKVRRYL